MATHSESSSVAKLAEGNGDSDQPHAVLDENSPLLGSGAGAGLSDNRLLDCSDDDKTLTTLFKEELRTLAWYTLPVFGTQVLEYSFMVVSIISIGHISTISLAAATLGSMTASVTGFSIVLGAASTLDTLLPSAWTSSQPNLVGLWSQRMAVVLGFTMIPILAIWFTAEPILLGLKQDPEVARLASVYLRWLAIGLPAYTFNNISRRYFQSQGRFAVPTRIILVVAPINGFLNWFLVWGPGPFNLGYKGAPLATAISYNLVAIASIMYGFLIPKTAWHPWSKRCFTGLGALAQLSLSGVGQIASEWWSWELMGLAASFLGPVSLAAQSVIVVSGATSFQAPFSIAVAVSVRVGNLLGERKARRAGVAAKASLILTVLVAAVFSMIFFFSRRSWAYIFNDDPAVVRVVASIMPLVALFQIFDGLNAVTGGILRSRGRQFTGAMLNFSAYYVIGIPLGIVLAFPAHVRLLGLWLGLTAGLTWAAGWGIWLCLRADWNKEVEKAMKRVTEEQKRGNDDLEGGMI